MTDLKTLSKFSVKVIGIHMPGNLDRPIGYEGHMRFVVAYWDHAVDDLFITDGLAGRSGGAWWLYTNLIEHDACQEIAAALMACGCSTPPGKLPFGDSETEATHGLILDRLEHALWVARLEDAFPFLQQQHQKTIANDAAALVLARQRKEILDEEAIHFFSSCHCDRGWVLSSNCYVPCSDCQRSGRIEIIPQQVIL
jgi:hypothetical protein